MTDDQRPAGDQPSTRGEVDALVERLVPGLAERLRGSVDEIEIARDGWRLRVRRNHQPAPRAATVPAPSGAHAGSNGAAPAYTAGSAGHGPQLPHLRSAAAQHAPRPVTPGRVVATAPAVGVFMPRGDVAVGSHVQAGDRLGIVDLLGVPQDVVAPADGVYTASLVEAGEGVEYGQELLVIEARA
jgi:biotin carboxyl carrier protein